MRPIKAIVLGMENHGDGINVNVGIYDPDNSNILFDVQAAFLELEIDLIHGVTTSQIFTLVKSKIQAIATTNSWVLADNDFYFPALNPDEYSTIKAATLPRSFNYAPGRSIVTGTGATGFQISSTRDAMVTYSPKITTTATIAGGQEGYVVLEIASTNSATAGDWKEVARVTNGQALSLAITLQSVQPISGSLHGVVPAGYYSKIRSVNTTGTPAYSMLSGQEVLM